MEGVFFIFVCVTFIMKYLLTFIFLMFFSSFKAQTVEYVYPDASGASDGVYFDGGNVEFFQGTVKAAIEKAKSERKLVFIDFYADWCAPCKEIEKTVFPDSRFHTYVNENFVVLKIHTDNYENGGSDYAEKMGVGSLPTMMVINSKGDELGRITGFKTTNTFLLELQKIERYNSYKR